MSAIWVSVKKWKGDPKRYPEGDPERDPEGDPKRDPKRDPKGDPKGDPKEIQKRIQKRIQKSNLFAISIVNEKGRNLSSNFQDLREIVNVLAGDIH